MIAFDCFANFVDHCLVFQFVSIKIRIAILFH